MNGITFYEDCLIGASNAFFRYWCGNPAITLQASIVLFIILVLVSLVVGKKRGWKWGLGLFIGGTAGVVFGVFKPAEKTPNDPPTAT